jgi:trimeric autotransporter adhesin
MNKYLLRRVFIVCTAITFGISDEAFAQCNIDVENLSANPSHPNSCDIQNTTFGSGAYRDITVQPNTYYVFSWNNNGATNINGFCAAPQNGSGSSGAFNSNQTAWFSGTTTVLRVSANRSSSTWVGTSATLSYRRTEPTLSANSPLTQTICAGQSINISGGTATNGTRYWQGTTNLGTSTSTSGTPNSTGALSAGNYTFYYRPLNGVNGGTGGCWGAQQGSAITVNALPVASANPTSQSVCSGSTTSISLSSSLGSTTYAWTAVASAGVTGHSDGSGSSINQTLFKASGAPGTVTYTITPTAASCPGSSIQVVVTVNPIPVATATPASQDVCSGGLTAIALTSTVPGTNFAWTSSGTPGTGGFTDASGNNIAQVLTKTVGSSGTVTYVVTPSANSCTGGSINVPVTVNPLPTPTFNSIGGPYCISQTTPINLLGSGIPTPPPGSGLFSGTGVSGNNFVPSSAAVGSNTLTYTYTDANGCSNSAQTTVQITGLPLVNFAGLSAAGYCVDNSTPVTLTGFPSGGVFSGPGISGNAFTPSVAGVGLHSIIYTYSDANGCVNSQTQSVNVFALPLVGIFDINPQYCVSDAAVTVSGFPAGGTFSGTGVSGNQFSPTVAGVGGPYSVTYQYTDVNGCTNSSAAQVSVNAVTDAVAGSGGNSCGLSFQLGASPSLGTGTWSLAAGPGNVTFTPNANAANALATVSAYGTYTFTWTEVNSACSSSDQVTVNFFQQPASNAGVGGSECDFSFNLAAVPSVGNGLWTQTSGSGTTAFGNSASASTTALVTQSGNYTFTWTETNGICVSSSAVNVLFTDQPTASAGPDAAECDLDHVLSASSSFGSGTWSVVSGPGAVVFSDAASPNSGVEVTAYGQYVFQWAETNGGCNDASTVTVDFFDQPSADAGFEGFECDLDFTFSAVPSVGTGVWTQVSGPGSSSFTPSVNAPTATVAVSQYGTYGFLWTEENGSCSDSDLLTVVFNQQNGADAGTGGTSCGLTFVFNATATVGLGQWSAAGPGVAFYTDDNSPTAGVTVSDYGSYVFTWTETNGSCITFDQVAVDFVEQPEADAGADGSACGLSYTLDAEASVGVGAWTLVSGPGTVVFDDAASPIATATVSAYGSYQFQWEEVNGTCSDNDVVLVEFFQQPLANAGSDDTSCSLDFALAATPSAGMGQWTLANGPGSASFLSPTSTSTSVQVGAYGSYTFVWTEVNGSCSDAASVTVEFFQQPVADAGSAGNACGLQYVLEGSVVNGSGIWSQISGPGLSSFNNPNSPTATVSVTAFGAYEFQWTVTNGACTDVVNVTIDFVDPATVSAGSDGSSCSLDYTLSALSNFGSGQWTQVSGPGVSVFTDPTSPSSNVTVSVFGTYSYSWTEGNGACASSDVVTVSFYQQPIANAGSDGSACDLDFSLGASLNIGAGTWTQSSGPGFSAFAPNAAAPSASVQVSQPGAYTFIWTVVNGTCSDAQAVTVAFDQQPIANIGALTNQCDLDITLSAIPSAGTGAWSASGPGNAVFSPNANDPNAVLTVDAYGSYSIVWTEQNGNCTDVASASVAFNAMPTASFTGLASDYCEGQTLPVQLNGIPSGGAFSGPGIAGSFFVPSIAGVGVHDVTYAFTDGNGCIATSSQSVSISASPSVSFSGLSGSYCVSDNAQIELVGSPAGGAWTGPGTIGNNFSASNAGVGTHVITYTYTDGLNCTVSSVQTVVVNALPDVAFSGLASSYCANDGSVQLVPSPAGGSFAGVGVTGNSFSPAVAGVGTHDVTYAVTSIEGCTNAATRTVTVNAVPLTIVSPNGQQTICQGSALLLSAPSGQAQYVWSNGQAGPSLTVTEAGDYSVTVTSAQGCSATSAPVIVSVNELPVVSLGNDTVLCPGTFLTLDAGNPDMSYLWGNLEVTQQIAVGNAGSYSVTVTDGNGCAGSDVISVSYSALTQPTIVSSGPTTFCEGGSVVLTGPNGVEYDWSNGTTAQNVVMLQSAIITLTVTDAIGCIAVSSPVNVIVNPLPSAVVTTDGSTSICPGASVTLSVSGSGNYLWSPSDATTQSVTVTQPGNYTVTVTDVQSGCSSTSQPVAVTQAQGTQPIIVASGPTEFCSGGEVVLSVNPPDAFSLYLWSTGETAPTVTVTSTAQIGLSVIDADNCLNQTLLAEPVAITVWNPQPIVEQSSGVLSVVNGPFECYQWFRNGAPVAGATLSNYTPEFSGNFYVQVCDANGCFANSTNYEFTVSIDEYQEPYELSVLPNPNDGMFAIEANLWGNRDVTLSITDVTGRELMQAERIQGSSSFRRSFNISHLSNGIYYLRVMGSEGMVVRPVVKR